MKEMTEKEALQRAASFCSEAEHCSWEVKQKLIKWGVEHRYCEAIITRLIHERFINESRYATSFIHEKLTYNKWGRIKIKYALLQKQLDEGTINNALKEIDEQEYLQLLQEVLASKKKNLKTNDTYEQHKKLVQFALGRGFEAPLIYNYLKTPTNDMD